MARTLPGSFLSFEEDDWDSFEPILEPSHTNGGDHLLSCSVRTPVKGALQVGLCSAPTLVSLLKHLGHLRTVELRNQPALAFIPAFRRLRELLCAFRM